MATVLSQLPVTGLKRAGQLRERRHSLLIASILTPFALLIHGFHPFAEDGGVYLAGVEYVLHPSLFPHFTAFVVAPSQHSAFAAAFAGLARLLHLSSSAGFHALIFLLHVATIWTTLFAASRLASRCWESTQARRGALLLLACWLGLPIAGTSLLLMDPYLTARSFSTPCLVFALIAAIDATAAATNKTSRSTRRGAAALWICSMAFAGVVHPLMAAYALLASVLVAACSLANRIRRTIALACISAFAILSAGAIYGMAPPDTPAYTEVALTRGYWFLSSWHWYEIIGIAAPSAIVCFYSVSRVHAVHCEAGPAPVAARAALARAALVCTALVSAIALLFAHSWGQRHLVSALQPMRGLQFVYLAMMLCLGATLGERVLRRNVLAWLLSVPLLALPLYAASRLAAPHTRHVELPTLDSGNEWIRAFTWIRGHTPTDALFALPSNYIGLSGEDAQCFRAIAERSALPDYSKDGGEAAVAPGLSGMWAHAQEAQNILAIASDAVRLRTLKPFGVTWLVLPATSATRLDCPYRNSAVLVCRLQETPAPATGN